MMKKAQSTLEFAVVITCVVAALLAMQIYMKRSMEGGLKASADNLGEQFSPTNTASNTTVSFYSPTWTDVSETEFHMHTQVPGDVIEDVTSELRDVDPEQRSISGNETVGKLEKSLY
jgi:hypothetical protein